MFSSYLKDNFIPNYALFFCIRTTKRALRIELVQLVMFLYSIIKSLGNLLHLCTASVLDRILMLSSQISQWKILITIQLNMMILTYIYILWYKLLSHRMSSFITINRETSTYVAASPPVWKTWQIFQNLKFR